MFGIVDRPASKPVITRKWDFKKKQGLSGAVKKYKARIVARGFMQQEGIDYTETYSPTVRFESIRMMTAATASEGMQMEQMDVTTAFLYAELEEEVYHGGRNHQYMFAAVSELARNSPPRNHVQEIEYQSQMLNGCLTQTDPEDDGYDILQDLDALLQHANMLEAEQLQGSPLLQYPKQRMRLKLENDRL